MSCPARDDLLQFISGRLDDFPAEAIATHVDSCTHCRLALDGISREPSPLAAALSPPAELRFTQEPALAALLPALLRLAPTASSRGEMYSATDSAIAAVPRAVVKSIRDYEIIEKLGEGGMGAVYKAKHSRLKKIVALKVLPRDPELKAENVARFEREMEAVGKVEHPNLVRAMDAGEVDGTHFLVMEYVGGPDLSQLIKQNGPLPIADACELVRQAAVGLQHVHEQGLVHRDIKPSNLMLSPQGTVKILDLGLALLASEGGRELTSTGQMMGTIDYMAPEQGGDTHHVDIRADIYSLGATLYKLLTGVAPFGDAKFDTPVKKLTALATQEPTPIHTRRPDVPAPLAAVVGQMLAKAPQDRYQTPAAVAAALAPFAVSSDLMPYVGHTGNSAKPRAEDTLPSLKSCSVETVIPPPVPIACRSGGRGPVVRNLLLGGLAAALLLGVITFFIPTKGGTVKVTINDKDVSVKFNSTGATIQGADDKAIDLQFGDQEIEIKRGDFKFTTTRFKLDKRGVTTLDVQFLPGELKVVYDGQLLERKTLPQVSDSPPTKPTAGSNQPTATRNLALDFDGHTTHVLVPTLQPETDQPLTLEALVRSSHELKTASVIGSIFSPGSSLSLVRSDRGVPLFLVRRELKSDACSFPSELKPGDWLHVAGVWDGKQTRLYLQGKPFFAREIVNTPPGTEALNQHFTIGAQFSSPGLLASGFFAGQLDEVRLSKIARYDKAFDPLPPGERFEPDEHTLALYHCDEGQGERLTDASGKKHHGKIVGGKWVEDPYVAKSLHQRP